MPLVVSAELPIPVVVIVVPDEGRVVIFVDPHVSAWLAADTVARVRAILHGVFREPSRVAVRKRLAETIGPAYALG